ncbi:noggin-2-like isoform X2 [Daktulosphaira vitifoliae]|uniref:noggin-2-like isoform X2 n=1 Tax=Daktulosphaira vitifoliae TaxID=58002 RepID=UPI0021AA3FB2|nr:noggin-2-like isoform X2 [Daktulosphaira vitifoliae]
MLYAHTLVSVYQILTTVALLIVAVSPAGREVLGLKKTSLTPWFQTAPRHPKNRDMKIDKLNRLIGSDYDEMWMSKSNILTAQSNSTSGVNDGPLSPDNIQLPDKLPIQYQELMRNWLVRRGSCPVEFVWTDLGKLFWPRWIKKGRCGRSETVSCSWPPGMSCIPSSIKALNLLRWHCWLKNRKRKHRRERSVAIETVTNKTMVNTKQKKSKINNASKKNYEKFRCLWIKVPYPVTEDCTCSCRKIGD